MTRRHWSLIALAIFLAVAIAACGSGAKQAAPAQESEASAQATPTEATQPIAEAPTAAPAKPTAKPTQAEPAATPEDTSLTLSSRDAGLDALTSFRLTWHAEWTSADPDKPESGTWDWVEEYTADPQAHHLSMASPDSNDPAKINTFEIWQIGDTTYMKTSDDQKCLSISSEGSAADMEKGMFSPSMLGSIQNATYVGNETINGVPAKHYTYNTRGVALVGLGDINGETWVAIDGGYVVKDIVAWKGGAGLFGLGGSSAGTGEGSWTWELSNVNQAFEIKQAEDCQASAALDLPMMPDASEKSQFGEMVTYKTASTVADVVAFYKDKLPAAGWTIEGEPTELGEMSMLSYTKDGKTLSVTVTTSDNTTQVMLNIGE